MRRVVCILIMLSFFAASFSFIACGRQPSPEKSVKIMKNFFKKYSKKYPDSVLGKYPVEKINLLHMEEIHKNFAAAYAILELSGGMALQTRFTILKKPFGWRANSWENMGLAMGAKPAE